MLTLRLELSLLVHAFKKDAADPDRTGVHIDHLAFYYTKYYKKNLTPKDYGVETMEALIGLVLDAVYINKQRVVASMLPEEFESYGIFVKLVEEARRHRILLVDSGDESARLKLHSGGGKKNWRESGEQNGKGGGGGGW